jgi:hypothetical protein
LESATKKSIDTCNLSAHFTYKIANIGWKPNEWNHVQFILLLGNNKIQLLVGVASEGVDFVADGESVVLESLKQVAFLIPS